MSSSNETTMSNSNDGGKYKIIPQVVPMAVLILLTNGVVFLLFFKTKSLRTPANYLLLSLAISDIMTGLINIPIFTGQLFVTEAPQLQCALLVLHNVIAFAIAYHITAIAAEKYLAVVNPFGRNMMTKKTVAKIVFVVWFWSVLLGALPSFWFYKWQKGESLAKYLYAGYNIFCLVVVFLVPFTFILYAYCIMFRVVSSKRMQRRDTRTFKKSNNEKKCLIILLTMAIAFAACWLPWFTISIIYSLYNIRWITKLYPAMRSISQTFVIVRYLSSAINPLLYTFFKQDFWSAFRVVLLKKHPRRSSTTQSIMRVVKQTSTDREQNNTCLLSETDKIENFCSSV